MHNCKHGMRRITHKKPVPFWNPEAFPDLLLCNKKIPWLMPEDFFARFVRPAVFSGGIAGARSFDESQLPFGKSLKWPWSRTMTTPKLRPWRYVDEFDE